MVPPPFMGSGSGSGSGTGSSSAAHGEAASGKDDVSTLPKPLASLVVGLIGTLHSAVVVGSQDAHRQPSTGAPSVSSASSSSSSGPASFAPSSPLLGAVSSIHALQSALDTLPSTSHTTSNPNSVPAVRIQVAQVLNEELLRFFVKSVARAPLESQARFLELLYALKEVLDPSRLAYDWWDLLLRPLLHAPEIGIASAAKARGLTVLAMRSVPKECYPDEPPPSGPNKSAAPHDTLLDLSFDSKSPVAPSAPALKSPPPPSPLSPPDTASATPSTPTLPSAAPASSSSTLPPSGKAGARSKVLDPRAFARRVFMLYVEEHVPHPHVDHQRDLPPLSSWDASSPVQKESTWKYNLGEVILQYGQESPLAFFHHIAELLPDPNPRLCLLELLVQFFRVAPNLIYQVVRTRVPHTLLLSLELDTSKTIITVGLRAVTMLIPHIPDWIASGGAGGLPAFLSVLARIIDWRRFGRGWEDRVGSGTDHADADRRILDPDYLDLDRVGQRTLLKPEISWTRIKSSADSVDLPPPDPQPLFTFLYGIFPCNTVRFFRDPLAYMSSSGYVTLFQGDWADVMDARQLQLRVRRMFKRHILHPSLITLDAQQELNDTARWSGYDANIVATKSLQLYLGNSGHGMQHQRDDGDQWDSRNDTSATTTPKPESILTPCTSSSQLQQSAQSGPGTVPSTSVPLEPPIRTPTQRRTGMGRATDDASLPSPTTAHFPSTSSSTDNMVGSTSLSDALPGRKEEANASTSSVVSSNNNTNNNNIKSQLASPTPIVASTVARGMFSNSSTLPPASASLSRRSARGRRSDGSSDPKGALHPLSHSMVLDRRRSPSRSSSRSPSRSPERSPSHSPPAPEVGTATDRPATSAGTQLERQVQLLRNELDYELYLQEQHLTHMGHVHSKRIKNTASEAEHHNLEYRVRQLTLQLTALERDAQQEREHVAQVVKDYKHWTSTQSQRQASHSLSERVWKREKAHLTTELNALRAEFQRISERLQQEEANKEQLRGDFDLAKPKMELSDSYAQRVKQLTAALAHWDGDVQRYEAQRKEMLQLLSNWATLARQLATAQHSLAQAQTLQSQAEDRAQRFEAQAKQLAEQVAKQRVQRYELLHPPPLDGTGTHNETTSVLDTQVGTREGDKVPSVAWYTTSVAQLRAQAQAERERLTKQVYDLTCELDAMRGYEQLVQVYQQQLSQAPTR